MLGYIFIILGLYATYAFWSKNLVLVAVTGLVTLFAVATQYLIVTNNKNSIKHNDDKIVLANMVASIIILILFIISFF